MKLKTYDGSGDPEELVEAIMWIVLAKTGPAKGSDEEKKNWKAIQKLVMLRSAMEPGSPAATWMRSHLTDDLKKRVAGYTFNEEDWDKVTKAFVARFSKAMTLMEAVAMIETTTQRGRSVEVYNSEYDKLSTKLKAIRLEQHALVISYIQGLDMSVKRQVKFALANKHKNEGAIPTLLEVMESAKLAELHVKEEKKPWQRRVGNSGGSEIREKKASAFVPQSVWNARFKNGECGRCGKKGHDHRDCPNEKNAGNA